VIGARPLKGEAECAVAAAGEFCATRIDHTGPANDMNWWQ
jgi:hypothetical protein